MRRLIIAFAAVIAATSATAFTNTPAEEPPNANGVINSAFAAMAAGSPAFTPANTLAFAPPDAAASPAFEMPATVPATPPVDASAAPSVDTPASPPASPSIVITVNKATQRMSVVVNGVQRWNWAVSTGRRGYFTPNGSFRPFRMVRDHRSREWDNAPMPYSIFFTTRGHAIHGSSATGRLGSPASHGCVRLETSNARQLFALVQQHGVSNTSVVIAGAEQAPAAYARVNTAPNTQKKAVAKAPKVQQTPPSAQRTAPTQQRVAQQTPPLSYRPAPQVNTAYRPPSYQPPQGYARPLNIAPRGFAPSAN